MPLAFNDIVLWLMEHDAILSGSRMRGDEQPNSDWDYWLHRKYHVAYATHLSNHGQAWEPFSCGIKTFVGDKRIDVSDRFPKSIEEVIDSKRPSPGWWGY